MSSIRSTLSLLTTREGSTTPKTAFLRPIRLESSKPSNSENGFFYWRVKVTSGSGIVGLAELKFKIDGVETTLGTLGTFKNVSNEVALGAALTNGVTSDLFNASSPVDAYIQFSKKTNVTSMLVWSQDNYNGAFNRPNGWIVYGKNTVGEAWKEVKDFGVIASNFWGVGSRELTL